MTSQRSVDKQLKYIESELQYILQRGSQNFKIGALHYVSKFRSSILDSDGP